MPTQPVILGLDPGIFLIHTNMKNILTLAATLTLLLASCTQLDNLETRMGTAETKISDIEKEIKDLQTTCNNLNSSVLSLRTLVYAMQDNDFVTKVEPVTFASEVIGYKIYFTKSDPITIYHGEDGKDGVDGKNGTDGQDGKDGIDGKDGKDGQDGQDGKDGKDGKDGTTPVISVKQDTDGIWYWTVNGEFLLDGNGNKVRATAKDGKDGKDGADGQDGKDGKDGEDGITPVLKIEDDWWFVSYDNGETWVKLSKATPSTPVITAVEYDEQTVTVTLADETKLTLMRAGTLNQINSIVYVPDYADEMLTVSKSGKSKVSFQVYPEAYAKTLYERYSTGNLVISTTFRELATRADAVPSLETTNLSYSGNTITLTVQTKDFQDEFWPAPSKVNYAMAFVFSDSFGFAFQTSYIRLTNPNVVIPDEEFSKYLVSNFDLDKDGGISSSEAKKITKIDCSGLPIRSLSGIEKFSSLNTLKATNTLITTLDLSSNTALTEVELNNCELTSVFLGSQPSLQTFYATSNNLSGIDLSACPSITYLRISENKSLKNLKLPSTEIPLVMLYANNCSIESIDLKQAPALKTLELDYNPYITVLDLTKCAALTSLTAHDCSSLYRISLKCPSLTTLYCYSDAIMTLGLSNETSLKTLQCHDNRISSLDISETQLLTSSSNWAYMGNQYNARGSVKVAKDITVTMSEAQKDFYSTSSISSDVRNGRVVVE